jgi:outer membrane lipoprotein-sorting protein
MRAAIVFAAALAVASPAAAALALDALMQALSAVPSRRASFEETRQLAVLTQPLVRRGTLEYVRPDRLEMHVTTPYAENVVVSGGTLTVERRSGVTRVELASQPALAAWIESLRATLAGDAASLRSHFDVAVEGTLADWHLTLVPREPALRAVVARVRIDGREGEPLRFTVDEVRGDQTVVDIAPRRRP